jgi:outer membrane protein assembly factor BamB
MQRFHRFACVGLLAVVAGAVLAADWRQFRGPDGQGISTEKGLPTEWSADKNIAWKIKLPGAGASCPVILGNKVFVTCYSGYGASGDPKSPGKMDDLCRHLLCLDRTTGNTFWAKEFQPILPEHNYAGEGSYHGYAASTPLTDGERLYVFFGKSGVYCFDLDGKELWHSLVGKNTNGWGSGASPILYKDSLIVNASVESGALVALNKTTGKEEWRSPGINSAWNTPIVVTTPEKTQEVVVSVQDRVVGVEPDTGKELWHAEGVHRYVCPSVVAHDGIVYAIGGGSTSLAVKSGGKGDVTKSHGVWRLNRGSNVGSPIYHEGHIYWANDNGGTVVCQEAATGKVVYSERLVPDSGQIWASPVLADGKLYIVSKEKGTYVVAAQPTFKQLAHNVIDGDKSRSNASLAVSDGQLFLRNDQFLYCIGKR